ncbi:MAG: hypothetical protein J0L92_36755, partial [Deltaproteobacteria bacterium]|nr:hypothetical protein [Deltaproteobacteria bacterium]
MAIVHRQARRLAAVAVMALMLAACASPIERARIALDEGELDRAVEILEGIVAEHPEEPGAWL